MRSLSIYSLGLISLVFFVNCGSDSSSPLVSQAVGSDIDSTDCTALFEAGIIQKAAPCFERSLTAMSPDSSSYISDAVNLSDCYLLMRKAGQALATLRNVDSLFKEVPLNSLNKAEYTRFKHILANSLTSEGFTTYKQRNYERSQRHYDSAMHVFQEVINLYEGGPGDSTNHIGLVKTWRDLSIHYSYRGLVDKSINFSKNALEKLRQNNIVDVPIEGFLLRLLAYVYEYDVEWDSSRIYIEERIDFMLSRSPGDTTAGIISDFTFLTKCFINEHQYDSALVYSDIVERWLVHHPKNDSPVLRYLWLLNLGKIYQGYGDYPRALSAFNQALQKAVSYRSPNHEAIAWGQVSPLNLIMGKDREALEAAIKVLSVHDVKSTLPDTQQQLIEAFLNKSEAQLNLGQMAFAQLNLDSAQWMLDNMTHTSRVTEKYLGKIYATRGKLLKEQGNFIDSEISSNKAINHYQKLFGAKYEGIGEAYINLSRQAWQQKKLNLAWNYAQDALSAVVITPVTPNISKELSVQGDLVLSYSVLAQAYDLAAKVLIERYSRRGEISLLYQALDQYRKADQYLSSNMSQLATESSILAFRNSWYFLYEEAIQTSIKLWKLDPSSHALDSAYQYAEKSKAHVLRQSQQDFLAKSEAGLNSTSWEQERKLKQDLAFARTALINASSEDLPELDKRLYQAREAYIAYVKELEEQYPKYYELKYKLPISSIPQVQTTLSPDQVFIQYFDGETTLYQFVITSDSSWVQTLPKTNELVLAVDSLQQIISVNPKEGIGFDLAWDLYRNYGYRVYEELYQELMGDLKEKKEVKIVPDGILMKVPTSALLTQANFEDPLDPPYFLNDVTISYDFSGTTHVSGARKTHAQNGPLKILGVTPDFSEVELVNLDRTTEGLRKIKKRVSGKFLEERMATKANVLKHIQEYGILYFATHAQMDTTSPLFSNLAFTPEKPPMDKERDFLYAYELYNYSLKAHLTILGACETGVGAYERSEGMISLGRAFAYAGCPSLVMSLWKAQYITTSLDILPGFVENLTKKHSKARALQEAKKEFLAKAKEKGWREDLFPYAWATFISVGNQSPLDLAKPGS